MSKYYAEPKEMQELILDYQKFPSGKQYACVRYGKDKIFLRNIAFLHPSSDKQRIVLVHEWDYPMAKEWEPPKGQMEWKEFSAKGYKKGQKLTSKQMIDAMKEGVLREVAEEAKIPATNIRSLEPIYLSYTEPFPEAGPNAFFRYQFWEGIVSAEAVQAAQKTIERIVANPHVQAKLPADKKEKDAVGFWKPTKARDWDKIRGAFSGAMTRMYYGRLAGRTT
jgi:hypothetical protein